MLLEELLRFWGLFGKFAKVFPEKGPNRNDLSDISATGQKMKNFVNRKSHFPSNFLICGNAKVFPRKMQTCCGEAKPQKFLSSLKVIIIF